MPPPARARTVKRERRPKRKGSPRADILRASLREFVHRGYNRATVRGIAKDARVDPALVYHYFGSKEGLFVESMRSQMLPPTEAELPLYEPTGKQAKRVVRILLGRWGGGGEPTPLLALLWAASSDSEAAAPLRQLFSRQVTPYVSRVLPRTTPTCGSP